MKLPGANTLLVGPTGVGKTHSLGTLCADYSLSTSEWTVRPNTPEVFIIFTEPFMDVVAGIPEDKLHWHYISPADPDWATLLDNARKINLMSYEDLSKLKAGMNKQKYNQFEQILQTLANFKCDRTGEEYGPVDSWGPNRALAIDSLSGLSIASMDLVVGAKPTKAMGEWGVAMDNLERLVNKLCFGTQCWFTLTSHVERETDEITGAQRVMVSTLGRKLAPKLPRYFHEVVECTKDSQGKFGWKTLSADTDLKNKYLPLSAGLPPSFEQIQAAWLKRGGTYEEK